MAKLEVPQPPHKCTSTHLPRPEFATVQPPLQEVHRDLHDSSSQRPTITITTPPTEMSQTIRSGRHWLRPASTVPRRSSPGIVAMAMTVTMGKIGG
ncbi:hypothetical protein Celaphus_00002607 [Cervus elaphus hippelaphus]|uniref:Uncharacterized protein n=1 Tax=Cervus elaphus hippelaphus TaxID=46360 RepID=A0A212CFD1_CEREH|nr:hypothetical protein Celaphus_00002607 [Cervus elaphus hippelaphus]